MTGVQQFFNYRLFLTRLPDPWLLLNRPIRPPSKNSCTLVLGPGWHRVIATDCVRIFRCWNTCFPLFCTHSTMCVKWTHNEEVVSLHLFHFRNYSTHFADIRYWRFRLKASGQTEFCINTVLAFITLKSSFLSLFSKTVHHAKNSCVAWTTDLQLLF